jgi:hypothetical protein
LVLQVTSDHPTQYAEFASCIGTARLVQINSSVTPQALGASVGGGTQSVDDVNGLWRGDATSNEVTMELRPDGIFVRAVTNNVGQSAPVLYKPAGAGEYHYAFPGGQISVMKFQQPGVLRLTNPDGWTDVFRIIRKDAALPLGSQSGQSLSSQGYVVGR